MSDADKLRGVVFRYEVIWRERGNYAEKSGEWQTEYKGRDEKEASLTARMLFAEKKADIEVQVRVEAIRNVTI
jgi:hypothetical protein